MDESYTNFPTSHLLGSVPAVVSEGKTNTSTATTSYEVNDANLDTFSPARNVGGGSGQGYQSLDAPPPEGLEQQLPNSWRGVFTISSYTPYFNVDTDDVVNRLMSSFYPIGGDFFRKIDANPDLYGLIWISTTLTFVLAALGNLATYFMEKKHDSSTSWSFDVGYVNVAVWSIYGYAILVPLAFYFLLRYLGSNASLIRFWCMWGYSLFIFIPTSFLLLIPVEVLRWMIVLLVGVDSACFVSFNLKSFIEGNDLVMVLGSAFCLQLVMAIFIKVWFFP